MPDKKRSILEIDEVIKIFGLPNHYDSCMKCGTDDGSALLRHYGLCLQCGEELVGIFKKEAPEIVLASARLLIFLTQNRPGHNLPKIHVSDD